MTNKQSKTKKSLPKPPGAKSKVGEVQEILDRVKELPPEKKARVAVQISESTFHSSPLPPAKELKAINDIHKGAANRIIKMAEKEQQISIEMQRGFKKWKTRGQWFALVTVLAAFSFSGFLAYLGQSPWLIATVFGGTLASVVTAFIYGNRAEK